MVLLPFFFHCYRNSKKQFKVLTDMAHAIARGGQKKYPNMVTSHLVREHFQQQQLQKKKKKKEKRSQNGVFEPGEEGEEETLSSISAYLQASTGSRAPPFSTLGACRPGEVRIFQCFHVLLTAYWMCHLVFLLHRNLNFLRFILSLFFSFLFSSR